MSQQPAHITPENIEMAQFVAANFGGEMKVIDYRHYSEDLTVHVLSVADRRDDCLTSSSKGNRQRAPHQRTTTMTYEDERKIARRIQNKEVSREEGIKLLMAIGVPNSQAAKRVRILRGELFPWEPHPDTVPGL